MDSAKVSVSKGCFVFKPKGATSKKIVDDLDFFSNETWYKNYSKTLKEIEKNIEEIQTNVSENVLDDLLMFISDCKTFKYSIPAATLLTGINLPDHGSLFRQLSSRLKEDVSPHVAMLWSSDCTSVRGVVEQMTAQFLKYDSNRPNEAMEWEDESDEEEDVFDDVKRLNCNIPNLVKWWNKLQDETLDDKTQKSEKLVIIIPDFESFSMKVLHDFILILSGYVDRLPIVLVFGIATSVTALHNSLSHKVVSRLQLQLFQSKPSVHFLNDTVDKVFLTGKNPFQLGGKIFKFLTDVFLFYDFSVQGFVRGAKYCMTQHYYNSKLSMLCCKPSRLNKAINELDKEDLEQIRSLLSFRKYVEKQPKGDQVKLLSNNSYLKTVVEELISSLHDHLNRFYLLLRLLHVLVETLPHAPLGKQLRELYCEIMGGKIIENPKFKECFKLLNFLAKDELLDNLYKMLAILEDMDDVDEVTTGICEKLKILKDEVENVGLSGKAKHSLSPKKSPMKVNLNVKNRAELKEQLMSRSEKHLSKYEILRENVLKYIVEEIFEPHLIPLTEMPLNEVLLFDNLNTVKKHIVGSPRAALHMALNNPHLYLQCDCCDLSDPGQIMSTMPDICIVYKLHLESGALINMYDWLQSFVTIVSPNEDENIDPRQVDPKIQARFTRAVSELQFLGFVKSSKQKADHVARLTWGGNG